MIYVDNMFMRAKVGRLDAYWCHLFSDNLDPDELHVFAFGIGMHQNWFQHRPNAPWQDHYDITGSPTSNRSRRALAIRAGARPVPCSDLDSSILTMVEILRLKRCMHFGIDPDDDLLRRKRVVAEWREKHLGGVKE